MMRFNTKTALLLVMSLAAGVAVISCAKKADTSKPIEQIKAEVESMNLSQLESNAKAYASAVTSKKSEVEKITNQIKAIPIQDLLSEKTKSIKDQLSSIQSEMSKLSERYQIYAQKFQEKGGDLSKIQIA